MKLGAFNTLFYDRGFEEALEAIKAQGCDAAEKAGLFVSALSCHGNMAHPKKDFADLHRRDFRDAVQLAGKLGVERIVTFAGCPGTSDHDENPSWITCPWPDYFTEGKRRPSRARTA